MFFTIYSPSAKGCLLPIFHDNRGGRVRVQAAVARKKGAPGNPAPGAQRPKTAWGSMRIIGICNKKRAEVPYSPSHVCVKQECRHGSVQLDQRRRFHLAPNAPRWCHDMKLWPYDGSDASLAAQLPMAWDESILAAWNWIISRSTDIEAAKH